MKKSAIILFTAFPLLFTSCLFEENDLFEESAYERMESARQEAKTVLESAVNGWHVRYFPAPAQDYGGYNLFFKFSEGHVTVASEIEDDTSVTETSMYSFGEELGVTLNFDTKNSLINYFCHPKNPDGIGSTYKGMEGDYMFQVMSVSPEEVVLRGIVSGSRYILTAVDDDASWADELELYRINAEDMAFSTYSILVNGVTYQATLASTRRLTIQLDDDNTLSAPFIYTKTGISFYEPLVIDGVSAQDFIFKDDYYFAEESGKDFYVMTPEPLRSDMTLNLTVPEDGIVYNRANINVVPSADDEYYYVGAMPKHQFESYREKRLLQKITAEMNSNIASEEEAAAYMENTLHKGVTSYAFAYPQLNTEYVAFTFACAVSGGQIVSTTAITSSDFTVSSSLLPADTDDKYRRWLGEWEVTSTSSRLTNAPVTFTIAVKPGEVNSTFMVRGWGVTMYGDEIDIPMYYRASYGGTTSTVVPVPACTGILYMAADPGVLGQARISAGTCDIRLRYILCKKESLTTYGTTNTSSSSTPKPAFVYDDDNPGHAVTYNAAFNATYEATAFDLFGRMDSSTSTYYLPAKSGMTNYDYPVGPFTLVQIKDVDGNVVNK